MKILKTWLYCGNDYINNDAKVKYHCCIKRKYRGFAHRDCDINVKLNRKILVAKYLNKYGRNRSKQCVREVDLEYPELRELHDDYPLAPDKIEIKLWLLTKFGDLYNISTGNVKKLVPNFFNKQKHVLHYQA